MRIFRKLAQLLDVNTAGVADGDALVYDGGTEKWVPGAGGGGGGAPTDVDYLVGTASGSLSAEIVVGTSPGGELGGTWASPTVDATHSGSSHAGVQAAAEATAAGALATHAADSTGVHGITDTAALALTADVVLKSLFDANTVLKADSDNAPAALTMGSSTILARLAAGGIVAATPAEIRTLLGLVIGTNVQAWDADLDTYAGITPSANVQAILAAANYGAIRALLDLEAGTDFPALSTFNDHNARHENGGADEMSVAGLSGELADTQPTEASKVDSGAASDGHVLTADGAGGAAWEAAAGGSGAWTDYTPALTADTTNPTLGSGSSAVGRYFQLGTLVVFFATFKFGSSPNAGSGNYRISLPVARDSDFDARLPMFAYVNMADASGSTRKSGALITETAPSASIAYILRDDNTGFVANNAPWTWAQNDVIYAFGAYEAA